MPDVFSRVRLQLSIVPKRVLDATVLHVAGLAAMLVAFVIFVDLDLLSKRGDDDAFKFAVQKRTN